MLFCFTYLAEHSSNLNVSIEKRVCCLILSLVTDTRALDAQDISLCSRWVPAPLLLMMMPLPLLLPAALAHTRVSLSESLLPPPPLSLSLCLSFCSLFVSLFLLCFLLSCFLLSPLAPIRCFVAKCLLPVCVCVYVCDQVSSLRTQESPHHH